MAAVLPLRLMSRCSATILFHTSSHHASSPFRFLQSRFHRSFSPSKFRPSSGLKLPGDASTDILDKKPKTSKNEKKRDARRAVRWGMDLAQFPSSQIKRILRVARVEEDVFEALMVVKKLGPDVKEGKRRQFNYIGKLLRNAKPELMDALIQASKDGDDERLHALSFEEMSTTKVEEMVLDESDGDDDDDDEYDDQEEEEEEEEGNGQLLEISNRWFDGLISRNIAITNEVYSLKDVDFDRQELRKLVRRVHHIQENQTDGSESLDGAQASLNQFLLDLARRTATKC